MGYVFHGPYKGPKVDLDEEFRKQGLTEAEIKELYKQWDDKLEKRKKHWFWKLFKF